MNSCTPSPEPARTPRTERARGRSWAWLTARIALGLVVGAIGAAAELAAPARAGADQPPALTLPDTPQGKCAAAYFAMMEAAAPAQVEKFERAWASAERLGRTPMEERAARAAELREQWGRLVPERFIGAAERSLTLAVRSPNAGPMTFEFQFSSADAGKLDAIVISSGGAFETSTPVTPEVRAEVVKGAAAALRNGYVYPEVGEKMAASIEARLAAGEYDDLNTDGVLAARLTDDLRAISRDRHLGVGPAPRRSPGESIGMPGPERMRRENFAFKKVEILPGNIGYVRFDLFIDHDEARRTAAAALAFLANCDALIFDLRHNGGGSPEMIRFITSYLFDQPTHLNSMIDRNGNVVEEFWTVSEIPGSRFAPDLPVYVLTSGRTFSGAEEFSYNLKNLKRATIVGETTGGGAHPVRGEPIGERFMIRVPYMRANNPISKTNWEGTGVEPDVKTTAGEALEKAQALAQAAIEERAPR